jgi:signal transduction histidine kinase
LISPDLRGQLSQLPVHLEIRKESTKTLQLTGTEEQPSSALSPRVNTERPAETAVEHREGDAAANMLGCSGSPGEPGCHEQAWSLLRGTTSVLLNTDDLFAGSSEMAALMRARDWTATPLGTTQAWPQSLRTIVRVLLTSRFAMWLGWGPDLTFLYNDAYGAMTLGAKHPWALGRPSREVWAEIWPDIGPRIERVLHTGEATWDEELLLFLERSGYPEETYHTFSYSPVTDDSGAVCGHLCVVSEETNRVIGERRLALLRETAAGIAGTNSEPELFGALSRAVAADARDLPFTVTYLFDDDGTARLACRTGLPAGHPGAPETIAAPHDGEPWPLYQARDEPGGILVDSLADRIGEIPASPWAKPPSRALVLPMAQQGQKRTAGVFIAGLNPFRPLDAAYRSFVDLLVGQVNAGLANARAYEEERRRTKALAELDRAKTTFFGNVSHEFRTPLTLMMGPLEDLLGNPAGNLSPEAHDALTIVQRNGLRLLKLVNTLLEFSRIEAGRVRARFEPVDLAALTTDLASTFRSAMDKAGLQFSVESSGPASPAYVDRDMWEKIVLNLVSNAFKFTLQGSVRVRIAMQGQRAILEVQDSGAGIPEHELPHVFDRFHRVEGTPGRSHEGSGIGLALVHELVKLHGGDMSVDSQVGVGSRFTVSIPLGTAHVDPDLIAPAASRPSAPFGTAFVEEALRWLPSSALTEDERKTLAVGAPGGGLGRVLLADDNADMRDYARRLLSERWAVEAVSNGREALDAARARPPDVIVTDIMMPRLDGFGLLRELRADPDLQSIPVIMLSARAGEEARLEGVTASADDYLVKPFSARDLVARVDAQLIKARARALEQEHARRLVKLFTHAPVAIAILRGPDYVYELSNAKYVELVGGRDLMGKPIREALPELEGQEVLALLDGVRASGEPLVGRSLRVVLNRGPDGAPEDAYFDFVYQPTYDHDGRVDAIVVVAHDVTALAKAKEEAERANRLKDEFLATLSHELRTPLNAVLGYTQMLRGGVIEPQRLSAVLQTIERNAKLQEQLVSDVLDVSRIITGNLRLAVRPVDLPDVIRDAVETVAPAAEAKGVRLQPAIEQPGVPVAGDAQRLRQVVWNLLANAVKFTPRGGRVQVRLQRVNSHVELTVSDTGEGIAPEFLPRLFQRFSQADGTFARRHSGLGLGLAICRHLVEAHGGAISATSPGPGQGTTIRVELPLMLVHDTTLDTDARVHPALDVVPSAVLELADLTGLRVLLVDDDVDAALMAKDALTAAGASVVRVSNASGALAALDRERFDAAVIDIGMPDMDGYELLQQIRQRPVEQQGSIAAAALTAYARTIDRTRSLETGFQLHLSKPIQPNELTAAVLSLAGASRPPLASDVT